MDGDRLSMASVTRLAGDPVWAIDAARTIAVLADGCLALEDGGATWQSVRRRGGERYGPRGPRLGRNGHEMSTGDVQFWT